MTERFKSSGLLDRELTPFYLYYTVIFMAQATIFTFLNIYFQEELGFSFAQIGTIASIGPLVSIITQPWWGILSDRTNKRKVLMVVIAGAVVVALLFPLHYTFMYIAVMAVCNTMFNNSINPLGDAITLQFLENKKIKFNTIRMIGTISYALMAAVVGYLIGEDMVRIFYIKAILMGIALFAVFWMPDLQRRALAKASEAVNGETKPVTPPLKESLRDLFANKMVLCILATSLVFGLTMTFYHAFLGIQLRNIGATEVQVGQAMFISAASEVPVLLFVNKLFGKRKPIHLLMIIGFFMAFRLVMLYVSDVQGSLAIVYAAQLLHGLTFMVHFYFTVVLLNAHAPVHIKSTVQSLNAVIRAVAALIGAGVGGGLADRLGIGGVYLILSIFIFILCFALPGVLSIIYRDKLKEMKTLGGTK
jgi:PPP family 3-phenylpropionic acid transporter